MVAVRDRAARVPPTVDYDYPADVLYVSLGRPVPDEGEDMPRGVVLRYALKDGNPSGATVIGLRQNQWHRNLSELADIIARHLTIDPIGVAIAIEHEVKDLLL
jgi:hypothetical protein